MRGVVLAGGKGTRLGELTKVTNKHLLPVGPYPMIYYPILKLVGAGIEEIMVISGTEHMGDFVQLLGSGSTLKCELTYRVQDEAGGIAQALLLAENFIGNNLCCVILGDNIFYDPLNLSLRNIDPSLAHLWLKEVPDPGRYGVAVVENGIVKSVEEKPRIPKSNLAVTGIYVYPPDCFSMIRQLKPSARGEIEITDLNSQYIDYNRLAHFELDGYWTDAGTPESLHIANQYVHDEQPTFYESEIDPFPDID